MAFLVLDILEDFLLFDMKVGYDYIVCACLAGLATRYDGTSCKDKKVSQLVKQGKAIPICPEVLGGLPVPRLPARINLGGGKDTLSGKAKVINEKGEDVTEFFLRGAYHCLEIAKLFNIKKAIMKDKSPSCGCKWTHSSKNELIGGEGVTTFLLKRHKIKISCVKQLSNNLKSDTYKE